MSGREILGKVEHALGALEGGGAKEWTLESEGLGLNRLWKLTEDELMNCCVSVFLSVKG